MLSFGIFASGTPFFVMAGLYLFYMLINLGVRFNENHEQYTLAEDDDKLIEEKADAETAGYNPSMLILSSKDFKDYDFQDVLNTVDNKQHLWPPSQYCGLCIPDKPYIEENLLFSLFSRPPPVA